MKFTLDFSIYYAKDRMKAVSQIPLQDLNASELETISKYVLCGKDEDGTSPIDRKEIFIKTKFNSYQKDRTVSLDELMESPTFDENILQNSNRNYKKVKPTINKEKAAKVPGMKELWEQIDHLAKLINYNEGKEPEFEGARKLSEKELYYYKHFLIQLRTQQYLMMDGYFPTIQIQKNKSSFYPVEEDFQMNYPVLPRGVMAEEKEEGFINPRLGARDFEILSDQQIQELKNSGKPYFDFREPDHLYYLIQAYEEIKDSIENLPASPLHNLLWTLDFYIEKANLSEQQRFIVDCKKIRMPNKDIAAALLKEMGIYHQENYISTIWNKCVKLIVEAVELNYDEFLCKDYDKAWKVCNRCGRELLRDSRCFVKKAKASDGLTSRCKQCDKEIRNKN